MAGPFYVDSGAGGTNSGADWTNAYTSFWSLPTLASGEIVYVASRHVEASVSANKTLTCPTSGEPAYIYSVTTGTTTYATGAQVKTTGGSYSLTVDGSHYAAGIVWHAGNNVSFVADTNEQMKHVDCTYRGGSAFQISFNSGDVINPTFDLTNDAAASTNSIINGGVGSAEPLRIIGGSVTNATNRTGASACFINFPSSNNWCFVSGTDLSALPSACEILNGGAVPGNVQIHNCKMPETFTILRSAITAPGSVTIYNSEDDDTETKRTRLAVSALGGTIDDTDSVYMTDSNAVSSDDGAGGTVAYSWMMVSENTAAEVGVAQPLYTPWIYTKITSTGAKNLDVYFGATETLDNAEVWVEYEYMGTSGVEKFTFYSTENTPKATPTTYTTTGGTWNATVTEEYYARAAVTVNETGLARARVCVGATSKTIYVNPKIIVS